MFETNAQSKLTTRQVIQKFKRLYDQAGVEGCGELIRVIRHKKFNDVEKATLIELLMTVLYKFDTCTSNCFDELHRKNFLACPCNGETVSLPLEMDDAEGAA